MYKFALLVLSSALVGMILVIPPVNAVVVMGLIGLIGLIGYIGLYVVFHKKKTAAIGGLYVSGVLVLQALGVLDVLHGALLTSIAVGLVVLLHQR